MRPPLRISTLLFALGLGAVALAAMRPPVLEWVEGGDESALRLAWDATPGDEYELQESEDLGAWQTVSGYPRQASEDRLHHEFTPVSSRGFFRVVDHGPVAPAPTVEAFFSVAGRTGVEQDLALEEKLKELLRQAEPGSEVLAAFFTWTRETMADAFIEAYQRGVDVRLIVGSDYPAVQKLESSLRQGRVLVCRDAEGVPNGCHGGRINHNKFVLFSQLSDGSRDVVVQSSANLTAPQLRNNNNLVIARHDAGLYNAYHLYWQDLYREVDDLDYYWDTGTDSDRRAYFFPRQEGNGGSGANDTIVEILDEISTAAGTEIHLAMAIWTDARLAIAHRLVALKGAGVSVQVIVNPNNVGQKVLAALEAGGIPVTRFPALHSKYLLIEQNSGRIQARWVLTGSHNYTLPALRSNDEVLLRLHDPDIYDAFLEDWNAIRGHPLAE